jgi:hypothetical protein
LSFPRLLIATALVATAACGLGLNAAFAGDESSNPKTATTTATECIADNDSDYAEDGGKYTYTMKFQNNCHKPIACVIDAYIVGFRGPTSAHGTVQFPAMGRTPVHKSFVVRVKAMGGTAQAGRTCSFL